MRRRRWRSFSIAVPRNGKATASTVFDQQDDTPNVLVRDMCAILGHSSRSVKIGSNLTNLLQIIKLDEENFIQLSKNSETRGCRFSKNQNMLLKFVVLKSRFFSSLSTQFAPSNR